MKRKWVSSMVVGFVWISSGIPAVQAEVNPIADARSASSDKTEPIITAGPEGKTLVSNEETKTIAPGIQLTSFERFDVRGWLNGEILTVDLENDDVSTDLLFPGVITNAEPLLKMAEEANAVAGVNGDFFDINNTKAPSGAMIQDGTLLKGPQGSHTLTAGVDDNGLGMITTTLLQGKIQFPNAETELAAFNQSSIATNGIGLYTSVWGQAQRPNSGSPVYEVTVTDGKVTAVSNTVGKGVIAENTYILVGREKGAEKLKELSVGDEVNITYSPKFDGNAFMDFAIGGNVRLVENGQVLSNLDDTTLAPRTAVGFSEDGKTMILALVDGRQVDSRGMTIKEMGELIKEYGAYQALNLDGGGSSTMVARMPGEEEAEVVNQPSDGTERSVPNGIGIFVEEGSGRLTNFAVETVVENENSYRVFPGLSRSFEGLGHDENYTPVEVGEIKWKALPADVGTFNEKGVFYGEKSGNAVAQAQVQSAKGTMAITVLGELDRIETTQSYLGLEMGKTSSFSVDGFDENGYTAPIETQDIQLNYDQAVISVEENSDGSFNVIPKKDGGSTTIKVTVQNEVTYIPVTIGLKTVKVSDFETSTGWKVTKYPSVVGASMEMVDGREGNGLQVNYNFSTSTATRAAYLDASPNIELPGDVQKLGLWVHGDGKGAWLRTVLQDAAGAKYTLTLASKVDWTGWKYVETSLPEGIQYPVKLQRIYPVETNRNNQYSGQLIFDDLTVEVPPAIEMPEEETTSKDPIIIGNDTIGKDRWKFAVLSDSQFVAASPDSQQAQMARESLRQIVAAQPEFLVINGDLVDKAGKEDFAFAKQMLEEEVGDAFPIYYIPGNHEIAGTGSLDNFIEVFGDNRYRFDHKGTRFILLDSSKGSFRTSDFEQLIELKESLNDAAADPSINNVVVIGHHPTEDPLPTDNSQLSDRKESELLEDWLTEFRKTSKGKGIMYISGHAHTVDLERVEGVPYMVTGPAGKAPYGASNDGGFYAWTMFGIDPTPIPDQAKVSEKAGSQRQKETEWIQAEVRPILQSITMESPENVTVGETIQISAIGHQAGNLNFPLQYPASVNWTGSENVFVGIGDALTRAKQMKKYSAVFDLKTGELTGTNSGQIQLKVESNGTEAQQTITIQ